MLSRAMSSDQVPEEHRRRRREAHERAAERYEEAVAMHERAAAFFEQAGDERAADRERRLVEENHRNARQQWDQAARE